VIPSADARYVMNLRGASVSDPARIGVPRRVHGMLTNVQPRTAHALRYIEEQHGLCVILSRLAEQKVTSCVAVETRFVVKVRDQQ
jgi:hypothetical protein